MPASLTVPAPPPVEVFGGRPVVWTVWWWRRPGQHRAQCPGRGCRRWQWMAYGRTDPAHGEWVNGERVTAWPALRLVAVSCPTCGTVRVYDLSGDGWAEVSSQPGTGQLSLFPEIPHQQRRRSA